MTTTPSATLTRVRYAADRLGLAPATVYRYIDSGAIRAVRFGRTVRVPLAEIERLERGGLR